MLEEHGQPAEVVFLPGYTMTNVKLLLVSRNEAHPNGLGNHRGQVGRNFSYLMWYTPVTGRFDERRFNLYMGNTTTMNAIYDFYGMVFDHGDLDFIGGAGIYSTLGEREPVTSACGFPLGWEASSELVGATGEKPQNGVGSGKSRCAATGTAPRPSPSRATAPAIPHQQIKPGLGYAQSLRHGSRPVPQNPGTNPTDLSGVLAGKSRRMILT